MSQRDRSILISGFALVLALVGGFVGLRGLFTDSPIDALNDDDGQFIASESSYENEPSYGSPSSSAVRRTLPAAATSTSAQAPGLPLSSTPLALPSTTVGTIPVPVPVASIAASTTTTQARTSSTEPITTTAPSSNTAVPPKTAPTSPASGLNAVEREILRLTNQLRTNPSGPLARENPMPSCVNDSYYGITVDSETGHPIPRPELTMSEAVSVSLARDWSMMMDEDDQFQHRPNNQASAIYSQLGISWLATGENIAFFSGYPDNKAARIFFELWRESDSGHYCPMVSDVYTHIGVGYHKGATTSWATQNFYRLS